MTEKKTDAWMPLWVGAYLADTMRLTTVQHGAYLLLLMSYWRDRTPLPDDDEALRSITKTDKSDWKKMRPTMANFFKVGDGVWWHKRVEEEISKAEANSLAASRKAKAGAEARWGKSPKDATSNAPSIDGALPKDMPKQCPTTTPTALIPSSSHTLGTTPTVERDSENQNSGTEAGAICKALKALGMASVSPGHPELLAMIKKGVTVAMFEDAATKSVAKGKGFSYMLAILASQLQAAAAIESGPSVGAEPWDTNRKTIEAKGVELGLGKWDELAVVNREPFAGYVIRVRQAMAEQEVTA